MDQSTLVANQIADGQRLIDELIASGIDVTAAGWVKASEDSQWFFYIASPLVNVVRLADAYRQVYGVMRTMSELWIETAQVKLIAHDNPIANDLMTVRDQYSGTIPVRYQGPRLGLVSIEEAFIYPAAHVKS